MLKKILFQLHWLFGITAGLVLAVMGVSGASLSYQEELLRFLNPGVMTVKMPQDARALTPDELLASLRGQLGQRQVLGLTLSSAPEDAARVIVGGADPRGETLYADPYDGDLLGAARGLNFFRFMMQVHRWLAIGDTGKAITGASTLILVFLCLSGLYLRWPRRAGDWRAWLVLDWSRQGRGFLWGLHAVAGTWVLLLYMLAALTGLNWSFDWYRQGLFALAGETAAPHGGRRAPPPGGGQDGAAAPAIDLDPLFQAFRREVGATYRQVNLALPERPGLPLQITYVASCADHSRATDRLSLDVASGMPLEHERYADKSLPRRLLASLYPLHTGEYFGHPGRVLMMLASLGMPLFFVTGWQLYLDRRRSRRAAREAQRALTPSVEGQPWLIGFASQNGFAERLAWQAAGQLQVAGAAVRVRSLAQFDESDLLGAERVLFVVSTFGDGEAPDNARGFARRVLGSDCELSHLHYALLGLGDRQYPHFCAFARRLEQWLKKQGAQELFAPVEVDGDDGAALQTWREQLGRLVGDGSPAAQEERFDEWMLLARECLNLGSTAEPVWRLVFQIPDGQHWEAGDLVEVRPPQDALPRCYSVASLEEDGVLELLVRRQRRPDGTLGLCSGWLCELALGTRVPMRLRSNGGFRLPADDRPLLLIGNGAGLAGLRGLLRERVRRGQSRNWLIFGERSKAHDFLCRDELLAWQTAGRLVRLDLAFSTDAGSKVYVQDRLRDAADFLRSWLAEGAVIYLCGSRGMASGVEAVLIELLGSTAVERLRDEGRFRRDLF
ncbi:PepSY domain-containing protein [Azorhizophilus paspali]|uniref:PepSY domain-containing protein n=1 Tax=Azorhizophilus paspali TaxID=69963 RepID=A0ABV6SQC8_AZOPA